MQLINKINLPQMVRLAMIPRPKTQSPLKFLAGTVSHPMVNLNIYCPLQLQFE